LLVTREASLACTMQAAAALAASDPSEAGVSVGALGLLEQLASSMPASGGPSSSELSVTVEEGPFVATPSEADGAVAAGALVPYGFSPEARGAPAGNVMLDVRLRIKRSRADAEFLIDEMRRLLDEGSLVDLGQMGSGEPQAAPRRARKKRAKAKVAPARAAPFASAVDSAVESASTSLRSAVSSATEGVAAMSSRLSQSAALSDVSGMLRGLWDGPGRQGGEPDELDELAEVVAKPPKKVKKKKEKGIKTMDGPTLKRAKEPRLGGAARSKPRAKAKRTASVRAKGVKLKPGSTMRSKRSSPPPTSELAAEPPAEAADVSEALVIDAQPLADDVPPPSPLGQPEAITPIAEAS
jgi:hypothetical protein